MRTSAKVWGKHPDELAPEQRRFLYDYGALARLDADLQELEDAPEDVGDLRF